MSINRPIWSHCNAPSRNIWTANTHRKGKYHYTAGIQCFWFRLNTSTYYIGTKSNIFSFLLNESKPEKLETSRTMLFSPMVSFLTTRYWMKRLADETSILAFERGKRYPLP